MFCCIITLFLRLIKGTREVKYGRRLLRIVLILCLVAVVMAVKARQMFFAQASHTVMLGTKK